MTLDNLLKIHQLQQEAPDRREFDGLVKAALDRLADSQVASLSYSSRFDLAYSAAHGFALAALRAKGFRSDKRFLVFQCLAHTVVLEALSIRIFIRCHERRNLAEYEGHLMRMSLCWLNSLKQLSN
jgi:hypothetical protein